MYYYYYATAGGAKIWVSMSIGRFPVETPAYFKVVSHAVVEEVPHDHANHPIRHRPVRDLLCL
jgi:hypothetical protein